MIMIMFYLSPMGSIYLQPTPSSTENTEHATRSKGHRYQEQERYERAPGHTTRSKDATRSFFARMRACASLGNSSHSLT